MTATALALAVAVAACSGDSDRDSGEYSVRPGEADAEVQAEPAKIPATREMLAQAYSCRGLMSAAWAAVQVMPEDERPPALADMTMADSSVWNKRIGALDPSAVPEQEVDAMLAQGVRVLASREALERELPAIQECRKAASGF